MNTRRDVAILGMSCRFPGASDPEAFWQLLVQGRTSVVEVPGDRWNIDHYFDSDPAVPGKMYSRYGAFLEHLDRFDTDAFNLSPREAASLDPQQRLLLELVWESLEERASPLMALDPTTWGLCRISSNDFGRLLATSRRSSWCPLGHGPIPQCRRGKGQPLLRLPRAKHGAGYRLFFGAGCGSPRMPCVALGEIDFAVAGAANLHHAGPQHWSLQSQNAFPAWPLRHLRRLRRWVRTRRRRRDSVTAASRGRAA